MVAAAAKGLPRFPTTVKPSSSKVTVAPAEDEGGRPPTSVLALLPTTAGVSRATLRLASSTSAAALAPGVLRVGATSAVRASVPRAPHAKTGLLPPAPTGPSCPGERGAGRGPPPGLALPQSKQKRRRPKLGAKPHCPQVQSAAPVCWPVAAAEGRARLAIARAAGPPPPPPPRAVAARPPRAARTSLSSPMPLPPPLMSARRRRNRAASPPPPPPPAPPPLPPPRIVDGRPPPP